MLDEKAAQEISDLCVEKIDWTVVGNKGGTMTIFTGTNRRHAVYGTDGGDPVRGNSKSVLPGHSCWFEQDGTITPDKPVICTAHVHDGVAMTDVRRMPPMGDAEAYEDIANLELDRKLIHDEVPEGSRLRDTPSFGNAGRTALTVANGGFGVLVRVLDSGSAPVFPDSSGGIRPRFQLRQGMRL